MKTIRLVLLAVLCLGLSSMSFGQDLKVMPFGGYTVQDKVYGYYGDIIIGDGAHYGVAIKYEKSNQMAIDLSYQRQDASFSIRDYSSIVTTSAIVKGTMSYIMLGVTHSPDFSQKIAPYGGFMLGAAIVSSEKTSEEWKFAVGVKVGAVLHVNERVGIVVQPQIMIPVQSIGLGVGCGSGGCGGGAGTSSTATQLGFTGGVEIKMGN